MLARLRLLTRRFPGQSGRVLGALFWRWYWWRERRRADREFVGHAHQPLAGSERATFVEAIAKHYEATSFLEVGCGFGQNFQYFHELFVNAKVFAVEVNPERAAQAKALATQYRGGVKFNVSCADAAILNEFADQSVDVVCCCGLFLLLEPQIASQVLSQMFRVCRLGVILLEQHCEQSSSAELSSYSSDVEYAESFVLGGGTGVGYWLRDYRALAERVLSSASIEVQRVKHPIWVTEQWQKFASLITISRTPA